MRRAGSYRGSSYERINGYSNDEKAGRVGFNTIHPDDVDAVRRDWGSGCKPREPSSKTSTGSGQGRVLAVDSIVVAELP